MKKYFVRISVGLCGMDATAVVEAKTLESAEEQARILSIENAEMYGYYQDPDFFGDYDQVGSDWDEEEEEYNQTGELEYCVFGEYDPSEHDPERAGGGSFVDDFK